MSLLIETKRETSADLTARYERYPSTGIAGIPANMNTVRGLACLLIVALHAVGDRESNGLRLPMTSAWHYVMMSIEFLRIPLFTALSGFLYAGHRVAAEDFPAFWKKKLRRLGVPLVFATLVIWWLRGHALAAETPLLRALLFEYGHLWYLQALLVLFAGISIADAFFRPSSVGLALTALAVIMVSQSGITVVPFFGLAGAFYLAPYFLFGVILRERPEWLSDQQVGTLSMGIILIILASQQFGLFGVTNEVTVLQLPAAIAGMAGVVFLLQRFPKNAVLGNIGRYSYTIYLWHIVASGAARDVLIKAGVTTIPTLFLSSVVVGVAAPIVLYNIAVRIPLLSVAVTGELRVRTGRRAPLFVPVAAMAAPEG